MVQVERFGSGHDAPRASHLDMAVQADASRRGFARFSRAGYLAR